MENTKRLSDVIIENAIIRSKNFAGVEKQYNSAGNRNFCVLLDEDLAEALAEDGWNVKHFPPSPDSGVAQAYLQVRVYYGVSKPIVGVVLIDDEGQPLMNEKGKMMVRYLEEGQLDTLDSLRFGHVDLTIRPYSWSIGNKTGVKAYLKNMFITPEIPDVNPVSRKYAGQMTDMMGSIDPAGMIGPSEDDDN